jgi:GxxExxY protein
MDRDEALRVSEPDFLVERSLVVEPKAVFALADVHYAQLTAYLRAADARVGLLLNFGQLPLGIKRLVNNHRG